jgi:hypothetical protein
VKIVRCSDRTNHAISEELLPEVRSISADTRQVVENVSDAVTIDILLRVNAEESRALGY